MGVGPMRELREKVRTGAAHRRRKIVLTDERGRRRVASDFEVRQMLRADAASDALHRAAGEVRRLQLRVTTARDEGATAVLREGRRVDMIVERIAAEMARVVAPKIAAIAQNIFDQVRARVSLRAVFTDAHGSMDFRGEIERFTYNFRVLPELPTRSPLSDIDPRRVH